MEITLPSWAQEVGALAIGLVSIVIGVIKYVKTEVAKDTKPVERLTEPTLQSKDLKPLQEVLSQLVELHDDRVREAKRSQKLSQDLREATNELNESIILLTDGIINLVRFLKTERNQRLGDDDKRTIG